MCASSSTFQPHICMRIFTNEKKEPQQQQRNGVLNERIAFVTLTEVYFEPKIVCVDMQ